MTAPEITGVRVEIVAGRIEVVGVAGREEVSVVVNPLDRSRPGDVDAAEHASVERAGDTIVVSAPSRRSVLGKPDCVDVIIEGPEGLAVDATTKHGEVRLAGPLGSVRVSAQYGATRIAEARDLEVHGGHGKVAAELVHGDASIELSSGAARVGRVDGALNIRNKNGSVQVDSVTGAAKVETTNGAIRAGAVDGGLDARSSHGAIRVGDLGAGVTRLETAMGSVKVGVRPNVPVWLDAASGHGKVTTDLAADSGPAAGETPAELYVRTNYGAVTVARA